MLNVEYKFCLQKIFFTDDKSYRPNLKTNSVVSINLKNAIIYEFVVAKVIKKRIAKENLKETNSL